MRGAGAATFNRRYFILTAVSAAGGLLVGITADPDDARAATIARQPWNDNDSAPHEIDAWIAINPDDSILIRYQRSEMGQGSMTALPMIIAEELQCDWSKVRIEYASANRSVRENRVYGDMFSHGSMSVRQSQKKMQQVGASARERLIAAAATRWHVAASECVAVQSVVTHRPSGRALRYGQLAADVAKIKLAAEPAITGADERRQCLRHRGPVSRRNRPLRRSSGARPRLRYGARQSGRGPRAFGATDARSRSNGTERGGRKLGRCLGAA